MRGSLQKQLFQTAGSVAVAAGGTHAPLTSYKGPQHVGSDAGNSVVVGVAGGAGLADHLKMMG